jgi:acetyl-CoA C-acetyltransferase
MSSTWADWAALDRRTPVIVGVGQVHQQLDEPGAGDGPIALMVRAARLAGDDSGAPELLQRVGQIAVPEGTWRYRDPARLVGRGIGADRARTVVVQAGIPQQTLLDDAYLALLDGRLDVALVVGGEAARRAAIARRAGVELPDEVVGDDTDADERRAPEGEIVSPLEIAARVVNPAEQYALIDSALRHAEGRTIDEQRDEIAALWSGFSRVAAAFPYAEFRRPRSAHDIREPGPDNRLMAFPYNKWHCSQMIVDQAAALLLCTLESAEAAGVEPSRVIFPHVALESSFARSLPRRRDMHRWPAMEVLGAAATDHLGVGLDAIEHAEVYSCFPAAVRVQQRALGLDVDGVPTITGGEPFAGGPWNNFVLQVTVAMIELLRSRRGERGLVTTVSGFLTKPGLAVYGTEPAVRPLLVADLREDAERATSTVPLAEAYTGPATIAAVTVSYDRSGDARTIVVADTPSGARCVATSSDAEVAARATTAELICTDIAVTDLEFTL